MIFASIEKLLILQIIDLSSYNKFLEKLYINIKLYLNKIDILYI